ncbi:protein shisa-3-like [Hemicordylus capensis]|uniref:protein shisa-3-like n=1 Tax=Hemicordylus capensis TaxID=884348 RepID=UPI002303F0AC|nr:protein shisa-3-like [Hemicordylus capensis]
MERALLRGALFLLLALGGCGLAKAEGEACRGWAYGEQSSEDTFWCVKQSDGEDAPFCCGTCDSPSCSSSEERRLDPAECCPGLQLEAEAAEEPTAMSEGSWTLNSRTAYVLFAGFVTVIVVAFTLFLCDYCLPRLVRYHAENYDLSIPLLDDNPAPSYESCRSRASSSGSESQQGTSPLPSGRSLPPSHESRVDRTSSGTQDPQGTPPEPSATAPVVQALEPEETNLPPVVVPVRNVSPPPAPIFDLLSSLPADPPSSCESCVSPASFEVEVPQGSPLLAGEPPSSYESCEGKASSGAQDPQDTTPVPTAPVVQQADPAAAPEPEEINLPPGVVQARNMLLPPPVDPTFDCLSEPRL